MRFYSALLLTIASTIAIGFTPNTAHAASQPTVPANYQLIWNDEFNGTQLDSSKWRYRYPGWREGTIVAPQSVALDGQGHLRLSTQMIGNTLNVGMIGTQQTFQQKYGYFEARIKFQQQQGHHGAFWLQSPTFGQYLNNPGRSGAEIDVAEYFGNNWSNGGTGQAVYWNPYSSPQHQGVTTAPNLKPLIGSSELADDFHIFGLQWTEQAYIFSIDGRETFRTSAGLSHVPQYMVLSLLSSGWERSLLPIEKLPDAMTVDYVRVYEAKKTSVPESSSANVMLAGLLGICSVFVRRKS
jgi:beta-glucanase (GH16 family)